MLRRATSDLPWRARQYSMQYAPCPAVFFLLLVSSGHSLHTPYLSNKANVFGVESTGHCQSKDRWLSRQEGHLLGICFKGGFFVCLFHIGGRNLCLLTVVSWGTLFFIDTSVLSFDVIILQCIVCHSEMK